MRKAAEAGIAAAGAYYGGAQLSGGTVDGREWIALILIGLGVGFFTWLIPNEA